MLKKPILAALALTLTLTTAACGGDDSRFPITDADKEEVLTVVSEFGSEDVWFQEFRYFFMNNKNDLYGADAVLTAEQTEVLKKLCEDNVRQFHTVSLACREHGVELTSEQEKDVESYTENVRKSGGLDDDSYLLLLEQHFTTDDLFEKLYENVVLSEALMNKLCEDGIISATPEDVHKAVGNGDILAVKEIYVGYNGPETREIARARAEEALERVNGGESFEDMMREYSDYNDVMVPPEYGYYAMEYDALDSIWAAANELAEGENSVVIETEFGFHIVKRAEINAEHLEQSMDSVAESYQRSQFEKYLDGIRSSLVLEYTEYGAALDLAAMS